MLSNFLSLSGLRGSLWFLYLSWGPPFPTTVWHSHEGIQFIHSASERHQVFSLITNAATNILAHIFENLSILSQLCRKGRNLKSIGYSELKLTRFYSFLMEFSQFTQTLERCGDTPHPHHTWHFPGFLIFAKLESMK